MLANLKKILYTVEGKLLLRFFSAAWLILDDSLHIFVFATAMKTFYCSFLPTINSIEKHETYFIEP